MPHIEGERSLRITPSLRRDAGGKPCRRGMPVGGDGEGGIDVLSAVDGDADPLRSAFDADDDGLDALDGGTGVDRCAHHPQKIGIRDVPAEGIQADLDGGEGDRPSPHEPTGRVDDRHRLERRGVAADLRQEADVVQHREAALHQGRGTAVAYRRRRRPDQSRRDPARGKSERGGMAGEAGTDDDDFGGVATFARLIHGQ